MAPELTPAQCHVTCEHGTEPVLHRPVPGRTHVGTHGCVCRGAPLFACDAKFDSGTGWPNFLPR
jgi:peptide-methionine (R)-S-oxide reductase